LKGLNLLKTKAQEVLGNNTKTVTTTKIANRKETTPGEQKLLGLTRKIRTLGQQAHNSHQNRKTRSG
jgi:hypothetical protein